MSVVTYDELRELTRDLMARGTSATETSDQLRKRFGAEQSPTICTIYKWRRELRGGKGEREANKGQDQNQTPPQNEDDEPEAKKKKMNISLGHRAAKLLKKDCEKYCVACNREMSSRHYYELHMLRTHDVFIGDSKSLLEYLEGMDEERKGQLIYRCDSCFGGKLDYERLGDLRHHRWHEHGKRMRASSVAKDVTLSDHHPPLTSVRSMPRPRKYRHFHTKIARRHSSMAPFIATNKFKKGSTPSPTTSSSSGNPRRSLRIPKPSPLMLASMLDAKELIAVDLFGEKTPKKRKANEGEGEENEGEPIVTIMRDGRIETEDPEYKPKRAVKQEKSLLSPAALDAANSMLKLALAAADKVNRFFDAVPKLTTSSSSLAIPYLAMQKENKTVKMDHMESSQPRQHHQPQGEKLKLSHPGLDGLITLPKKRGRKPKAKKGQIVRKRMMSGKSGEGEQEKTGDSSLDNKAAIGERKINVEEKRRQLHQKQSKLKADQTAKEDIDQQQQIRVENQRKPSTAPVKATFPASTVTVPQDDCTWFGHSVAASLRQMGLQAKELAKTRIQQVICECASASSSATKDKEHHANGEAMNGTDLRERQNRE